MIVDILKYLFVGVMAIIGGIFALGWGCLIYTYIAAGIGEMLSNISIFKDFKSDRQLLLLGTCGIVIFLSIAGVSGWLICKYIAGG